MGPREGDEESERIADERLESFTKNALSAIQTLRNGYDELTEQRAALHASVGGAGQLAELKREHQGMLERGELASPAAGAARTASERTAAAQTAMDALALTRETESKRE